MQKVFNHFASGEKNGKPAMDLGGLMAMAKKTGILDGKLGEGDVQNIFNKVIILIVKFETKNSTSDCNNLTFISTCNYWNKATVMLFIVNPEHKYIKPSGFHKLRPFLW